jgi:hypothetical protein
VKRTEAALQKLREKEAKKKAGKAPKTAPVTTTAPGDEAKDDPAAASEAPAVEMAVPIETFPIEPLLAPAK